MSRDLLEVYRIGKEPGMLLFWDIARARRGGASTMQAGR